jgi:hypothetical protein
VLNINWYALITINKLYQMPASGSQPSTEAYTLTGISSWGTLVFAATSTPNQYFNAARGLYLLYDGSVWCVSTEDSASPAVVQLIAYSDSSTNPVGTYYGYNNDLGTGTLAVFVP